MKIIVEANEDQWQELQTIEGVNLVRVIDDKDFNINADASAYLNFVGKTESEYNNLPFVFFSGDNKINNLKNGYCINSWPGFLFRNLWEIKGEKDENVEKIMSSLGKKPIWIKDEFVSTRIISMIINEAYFSLEEKVSSKDEINIAMKLGTGYPFGPFEWAEKIGLKKVYNILNNLSKTDKRYTPSVSLKNEAIK